MFSVQPAQPLKADCKGTRSLAGNEALPLNTAGQIWQVESGALGIFSVAQENGEPVGARHYLFTVPAGEVALGLESGKGRYGLIAIAFEPTQLRQITWQAPSWKEEASSKNGQSVLKNVYHSLAVQLTGWCDHFSQIKGFPKPAAAVSVFSSHYLSLNDSDRYGPDDQLVWLRLSRGKALWLGDEGMPILRTGLFPMGVGTWIEIQESAEVALYKGATRQRATDLGPTDIELMFAGIAQFHAHCLQVIQQIITEQAQSDLQHFQQRQQLNQKNTQQTLQGLASLLKPEDDSYLTADTPLLIAAGAVGKSLGVKISPPSTSENMAQLKEPLEAIARASQLRLRQVLLRGDWWKKDSGPMVGYLVEETSEKEREQGQPVALLPVKDSRYELLDPVTLKRSLVDNALAEKIVPTAHVFYRPLPEGKLNAWTLLRFAFYGRQRDMIMVGLTGVAISLLGMAIPQATAVLIDDAIPYGSRGILIQIGLALLAVAFGRSCFQFAQAIASMRIETASDVTLQAAVWDRLLKLHTSFFRDYSTGDLQSRVSSISAIRSRLSGTALDGLLSGVFALLNLGLLFYYSARLAVLALFVAFIVMVVTVVSGAILLKKQRPLLELDGQLYGLMVQLINGVSKLRIAGAEPRAFAQWGEKYRQQLQLDLSTQRLEDAVSVFNGAMPTLTAIGLFALSSTLVNPMQDAGFTPGTFLAFNAAFALFIGGATGLSLTLIDVLTVLPLWQRSQPILAAMPEVDTQKSDPGRLTGRICLDHVTFRYRDDGPLILDDVTVEAYPGEFIALVGPSGSGKSTVLRLLLGFETPQSGTVYYDSQDVTGIDITAVRRQLGVVLQNGRINAGSIFENISGGALINLDDAWKAAEMAGFAEDVRGFPMQMHTVISEGGTNLSGGQRQRLVIARALALNPKILLLDEATSALDNRTQAIVSESLDRLNVTRIVVAHRLSTIRNADRIYVIKAGRVVQQGSFEELAGQAGVFAELTKRQMA